MINRKDAYEQLFKKWLPKSEVFLTVDIPHNRG